MSIDVARIGFSQKEYRGVTVSDGTVKTRHPLALELTYNTLIKNEADAISFGNDILNLRKLDRWNWVCLVADEYYPNLIIGKTITITYPRFGLQNGKNFIIKRVKTNFDSPYAELGLFGPQT